MIRLIAFDLDNTLAKLGKGITCEDLCLLRKLETRGILIAICSGKPVDYLCGFLRQAGLTHPILVGENGAVIQIGVDLPPREFYIQPYSQDAKHSITYMRKEITRLLPDIWYQPNLVGLTPFPKNDGEFEIIAHCLKQNEAHLHDVKIYRHVDSFDITPINIDKCSGMAYLGRILSIPPEDTAAVGDGVNDYPMFDYAGYAVGVHVTHPDRVNVNFPTSTQALEHLLEMTE